MSNDNGKDGYCALKSCGIPITDTNRTHIGGKFWCSQKCWSLMMHEKTNAESVAEYDKYEKSNQEKKS